MKIFITHSSHYDYKNELYIPLRSSQLDKTHEFFLPREGRKNEIFTKDIIKTMDLIIAEVSYPSTGEGIELGWADMFEIPIICIYKEGSTISDSVRKLTDKFVVYINETDMIEKITKVLSSKKR